MIELQLDIFPSEFENVSKKNVNEMGAESQLKQQTSENTDNNRFHNFKVLHQAIWSFKF